MPCLDRPVRRHSLSRHPLFLLTRIFLSVTVASAALFAAGSAAAVTYRLTHNTADTSTWERGAARFAELLDIRSKGAIRVRSFPNASLTNGDQMKQVDLVGRGAIDFILTSAINATPLEPRMNVFSLPYLFGNYRQVDAVLDGPPAAEMAAIMRTHGIVILAWGDNGFREVTNNRRPVMKPADMAGLKMRVAAPLYVDIMNDLGANSQQMQWTEVFTALQQGVVDGQENPISSAIVPGKIHEVQEHLTIWHYSYDPVFLGISVRLWDRLDAPARELVQTAARDAMQYERELSRSSIEKDLAFLKTQPIRIVTLTPEQIEAFRVKTKPSFDKWSQRIGANLVDLFVRTIRSAD